MSLSKPKPKFRFMDLPDVVKVRYLSVIPTEQQILYSLCSKKSKALLMCVPAKAGKLKIYTEGVPIYLSVNNERSGVELRFDGESTRFSDLPDGRPVEVLTPDFVVVRGNGNISWRYLEIKLMKQQDPWNVRQWIEHLKEIYKCEEISLQSDHLAFGSVNFEYYKKIYDGLVFDSLRLAAVFRRHYKSAIETFIPTRNLRLWVHPYTDPLELREKILYKEYMWLFIEGWDQRNPISLLDIFDCKSLNMDFHYSNLTVTDMNSFVRSWVNNGSMPNMESLTVNVNVRHGEQLENYVPDILRGVRYTAAPTSRQMKFYREEVIRYNCKYKKQEGLRGGYDFERSDGKKASLFISSVLWKCCIFVVWQ